MINIERLSNNLALKISQELKLDKDNQEIIAYGTFAMFQINLSILFVIIFGFIFGITIEALLISFSGSILRKYSGGAHASTPNMCIIIGTGICIGQALIISLLISPIVNPLMLLILGIITFIYSYYLINKLAPVDSPAKPIKTQKKINRMKKGSLYVLSVYLVISSLLSFIYIYLGDERYAVYTLCIFTGAAWQSFTLTKAGHLTIKKIDGFFHQILLISGRREKNEI